VNNKTQAQVSVTFAIEGLPGAELDTGRIDTLVIEPERSGRVLAQVRWSDPGTGRQHPLRFIIDAQGAQPVEPLRIDSQFFTP
jgi:glucose-6-phosphate dehydrogenase assembly protein OpcA